MDNKTTISVRLNDERTIFLSPDEAKFLFESLREIFDNEPKYGTLKFVPSTTFAPVEQSSEKSTAVSPTKVEVTWNGVRIHPYRYKYS